MKETKVERETERHLPKTDDNVASSGPWVSVAKIW